MCAVHKNTTLVEINGFFQWPINNECRLPWIPNARPLNGQDGHGPTVWAFGIRMGMALLFGLLGSPIAKETLRAVSDGWVIQAQMGSVLLFSLAAPRACALDGMVTCSPGGSVLAQVCFDRPLQDFGHNS